MKPVDDWGQEELVTAAVALVFLGGIATGVRRWWAARGPAYLQEHHLLLPPGHGIVHLGRAGDLNGWGILGLICALVVLGIIARLSAPALSRSLTTSRDTSNTSRGRRTHQDTTGQNTGTRPATTWEGRR